MSRKGRNRRERAADRAEQARRDFMRTPLRPFAGRVILPDGIRPSDHQDGGADIFIKPPLVTMTNLAGKTEFLDQDGYRLYHLEDGSHIYADGQLDAEQFRDLVEKTDVVYSPEAATIGGPDLDAGSWSGSEPDRPSVNIDRLERGFAILARIFPAGWWKHALQMALESHAGREIDKGAICLLLLSWFWHLARYRSSLLFDRYVLGKESPKKRRGSS